MDVHGNALTSPIMNTALSDDVKQMLSFLTKPDTIASQPAPPHRPRAYRGRPRCAWSWLKSTEKHWKAKTTHEMNHETNETVIQESYEQLWKLMKNVQTP